jgi:hypothetical protein
LNRDPRYANELQRDSSNRYRRRPCSSLAPLFLLLLTSLGLEASPAQSNDELVQAIADGKTQLIKDLLTRGVDANACGQGLQTPLMSAVETGNTMASQSRAAGGFLPIDENSRVTSYTPQYLATQVITKEWVQPVDAIHKLFKVASDVKDKDGKALVIQRAWSCPPIGGGTNTEGLV